MQIDYHKLAEACGMSNHRSASNAWSNIKKKLFSDLPAAVDEDGNPVATPKRKRATPAKPKKAAAAASNEGDELAENPELNSDGEEMLEVQTPVKKKRAAPKRTPAKRNTPAKAKKAANAGNDDEAEAAPAADIAKLDVNDEVEDDANVQLDEDKGDI